MKKTSEINASTFHKFTVPVTLIFVLVLGFIALLCLFILQQIYFLGALSKQIDSSQMTALINNIFRYQSFDENFSGGLQILRLAGYDNVSFFFLIRPTLPILTITGFSTAIGIAIYTHKRRKILRDIQEEERKIVNWIRSEVNHEIDCLYFPNSIIKAIVSQKHLIRKQKELHKEDTARIMHFAEDISHQLKTPLAVVRVACERLALQNDSVRLTAETCLSQISKMTDMIQDLLQLGRFDCQKQKMNFSLNNAYELLEVMANDLYFISARKNISVEIDGDPTILWYCDPYWIKEAIGNIVKNCIEHSADSPINIKFESNNTYNQIIIEDNGCGFEEGFESQIFERYSLGGTRRKEGAGLGMAIANEAIKMHYGKITAANRVEGGAVFQIFFPRFDADSIYS